MALLEMWPYLFCICKCIFLTFRNNIYSIYQGVRRSLKSLTFNLFIPVETLIYALNYFGGASGIHSNVLYFLIYIYLFFELSFPFLFF